MGPSTHTLPRQLTVHKYHMCCSSGVRYCRSLWGQIFAERCVHKSLWGQIFGAVYNSRYGDRSLERSTKVAKGGLGLWSGVYNSHYGVRSLERYVHCTILQSPWGQIFGEVYNSRYGVRSLERCTIPVVAMRTDHWRGVKEFQQGSAYAYVPSVPPHNVVTTPRHFFGTQCQQCTRNLFGCTFQRISINPLTKYQVIILPCF